MTREEVNKLFDNGYLTLDEVIKISRNDAIDELLEKIKERSFHDDSYLVKLMPIDYAEEIAEQLKKGESND